MNTGIISHVLIINEKGEALILKRSLDQDVYPGYWDIPGGTVEEREDPLAGAVRETKEEAGLDVSDLGLFYNTWNIDEGKNKQFVRLIFAAGKKEGNIALNPEEHIEYAWVSPGNISEEYKLVDYLYDCFKKLNEHPIYKIKNND